MFLGHKKKLFLCLIIFYSNLSFCEANKNYTKKNTDVDPILLTAERIIFKSFIKSVWSMAKTRNNRNKYDEIKYNLGQIASDLIIDEALPSENQNKIQKISENLLPIIISECIIYQYENILHKKLHTKNSNNYAKPNLSKSFCKTLQKIETKIVKANFFLDKENKYYNLSNNTRMLIFTFLNTKTWKPCLQTTTKNIINEAIKAVIASKQLEAALKETNLDKVLNKKQRKKAISKAIGAILDPFINDLFN